MANVQTWRIGNIPWRRALGRGIERKGLAWQMPGLLEEQAGSVGEGSELG